MVWIPPGLNGDNHCIVNSELYVDDPSCFVVDDVVESCTDSLVLPVRIYFY